MSVNLTDVSSDGVISVQLHGPSMKHLNDLMEQINSKYSEKPTASDYIATVHKGLECCAKFNDQWYRVRLTSVSSEKLSVEYIDSGKRAELEKRNLRKALDIRLFSLPPQAVRCMLADLPPPGVSTLTWIKETVYLCMYSVGLPRVNLCAHELISTYVLRFTEHCVLHF